MSPEMAMSARPSHTPSNTLVLTTFESSHETGREKKKMLLDRPLLLVGCSTPFLIFVWHFKTETSGSLVGRAKDRL